MPRSIRPKKMREPLQGVLCQQADSPPVELPQMTSSRKKRKPRPKMTRFPSIGGPGFDELDQPCIAFRKYDGSNLQFKWTQGDGWSEYGTRKRPIDSANPLFGEAIKIFHEKYADHILTTFRKHREYRNAKELVAFCEFFGPNTFSGLHRDSDSKDLKLFDILFSQNGFVLPRDFKDHFGHLDIAEAIYDGPLSKQFMQDVHFGKYDVGEGVVAKGVKETQRRKGKIERNSWMVKIKTKTWLDELARRASNDGSLLQELEDNINQQRSVTAE